MIVIGALSAKPVPLTVSTLPGDPSDGDTEIDGVGAGVGAAVVEVVRFNSTLLPAPKVPVCSAATAPIMKVICAPAGNSVPSGGTIFRAYVEGPYAVVAVTVVYVSPAIIAVTEVPSGTRAPSTITVP